MSGDEKKDGTVPSGPIQGERARDSFGFGFIKQGGLGAADPKKGFGAGDQTPPVGHASAKEDIRPEVPPDSE